MHIVKRRIESISIEYGSEYGGVVTVYDAIKYLCDAWNGTTSSTIYNCYRKAGFKCKQLTELEEIVEIDPSVQEFNDAWNHLNRIDLTESSQNDYLAINADLPFAGVLIDEEIVASLLPQIESEDESDTEPESLISRTDAIKGLQAFKLFMLQSSQDRSGALKLIETLEKEIENKVVQSNITSFFSV